MEEIKQKSMPYTGVSIHAPDGTIHDYPFADQEAKKYFVRRDHTQEVLTRKLKTFPNVKTYYKTFVNNFDLSETSFDAMLPDGSVYRMEYDFVFGCDGVHSVVRDAFLKRADFNFEKSFYPHGYTKLIIPPNKDGTPKLTSGHSHMWLSEKSKIAAFGI